MKTLLSVGDLVDFRSKFQQKGKNLLSGLFRRTSDRVSAYWDDTTLAPSNWWNVPMIRDRWRYKISGDKNMDYPEYIRRKYLEGRKGLKMLSPGCGTGSHELLFKDFAEIEKIEALDISPKSIAAAQKNASEKISYFVADFHQWLKDSLGSYDLVLFHSSLHHFSNLEILLPLIGKILNKDGILVIHEYTGPDRMMWTKEQLREADRQLMSLPAHLRETWNSKRRKTKHYRPGLIRTLLTDPSESVESGRIIPLLHRFFNVREERPLGGNILHLLLKDIAHHFTKNDPIAEAELLRLFDEEDRFISGKSSDFMFGVYTPK